MPKNELTPEAIAHIVERPAHLEKLAGSSKQSGKIIYVAETLKLMERSKALCYDEAEFKREFSSNKHYFTYFKKRLQDFGIKKPRVVSAEGKVWIWSND